MIVVIIVIIIIILSNIITIYSVNDSNNIILNMIIKW